MTHVPLALNPLNPVVRSSLIWQMLYLMGASNSFFKLILTCTTATLDKKGCETHSHGPHIAHQQQGFFFFLWRGLFTIHVSKVPGRRSVSQHHLAARGYRDEYWWYEMPAAEPLPRNPTPGHAASPNTNRNTGPQSTFIIALVAASLASNAELSPLEEKILS